MKPILLLLLLAVPLLGVSATCTGKAECKACVNCSHCRHCNPARSPKDSRSKPSCGRCRTTPPPISFVQTSTRR